MANKGGLEAFAERVYTNQALVKEAHWMDSTPTPRTWNAQSWTDQGQIYRRTAAPRSSVEEALKSAKNLFYWYTGTAAVEKSSLATLTRNVWSQCTNINGEYIFPDSLFVGDQLPEITPATMTNFEVSTWNFPTANDNVINGDSMTMNDGTLLTLLMAQNWATAVNEWITAPENETASAKTAREQQFINYISVLFLHLMKFIAKSLRSTSSASASKIATRMTTFCNSTFVLTGAPLTPPPHGPKLGEWILLNGRSSESGRNLLYMILYSYIETTSEVTKGLLKSSCLLALSYTGLASLHWFNQAKKHLNLTVKDLMAYMYVDSYLPFLERYWKYIHEAMEGSEEKIRPTWTFARLFNTDMMGDMTVSANKEAVAFLVACCDQNHDMSSACWTWPSLLVIGVQTKGSHLKWAQAVKMVIQETTEENVYGDKATNVLKKKRELIRNERIVTQPDRPANDDDLEEVTLSDQE
nr:TPA_asm: glycoprotein [Draselvirus forcipomyiae]